MDGCVLGNVQKLLSEWRDVQLSRVSLVLKSLVPSVDMRQFTTAYSSSSRGLTAPFYFLQAPAHM